MATTSTVPAVKAAVVTAVAAALPSVQVVWGRPSDTAIARETVYIADVSGNHRIPVMTSGRKHREEEVSIDVVVAVLKARGTSQAAEERAWELLDALENVLADDPTLTAVDGLVHATLGDLRVETDIAKEGGVCIIVTSIDVLSRLN